MWIDDSLTDSAALLDKAAATLNRIWLREAAFPTGDLHHIVEQLRYRARVLREMHRKQEADKRAQLTREELARTLESIPLSMLMTSQGVTGDYVAEMNDHIHALVAALRG